MFKGLVEFNFLRAISASFSGIISIFLNLVCMLGCLFLFPSPDQHVIVLALIGLLQATVLTILRIADLIVGILRDDVPLHEIDRFFASILMGYIIGMVVSIYFLRESIFI